MEKINTFQGGALKRGRDKRSRKNWHEEKTLSGDGKAVRPSSEKALRGHVALVGDRRIVYGTGLCRSKGKEPVS